jgi:cellulose synthase/poly-beta-1,6-N-acetylglucosamine synthase-like glycosyltransferase
MVSNNQALIDDLLKRYDRLSTEVQAFVTQALSSKLAYIILYLFHEDKALLKRFIKGTLNEGIYEPLIDFLNENSNVQIESLLLSVLKETMPNDLGMIEEMESYLKPSLLKHLGLQPKRYTILNKEKAPVDKNKIKYVLEWLLLLILFFPLVFLIRNRIFGLTIDTILLRFIIEMNRYLIIYFLFVNSLYVILLLFAFQGAKKQVTLAKIKKNSLLFTSDLLPGISIIAPAFNESLSIIDSVNSLLNLKYPIYEVIVVNDGSIDDTLDKLIRHFDLERIHYPLNQDLATKKVRGVYTNKTIPNLIVVDKVNGGKADALNVGINTSKYPYICGIDADSLLENDALLKLGSAMLDDTKLFIAMGGNIYPANGFSVSKGKVLKRAIPKGMLTRFQTIEYLRAFTSGRIGWSEIKSLMIISGAFGLFHKESLTKAGGYLTSSGILKKDTVGEDMEMVVRVSKEAIKKKRKYNISYVYNAYCYTELPSDAKTLFKQRNRWQRGLVDILAYHRNMAFNPRFKQLGFIGYPYFHIFEFLGPFVEAFGYTMVIIALLLGLLNTPLLLGIFIASILFGIIISLSSLLILEKELYLMSTKETLILILFAILENFGYKQVLSLHRIKGTFSALKESGAWGTQKRQGFKS